MFSISKNPAIARCCSQRLTVEHAELQMSAVVVVFLQKRDDPVTAYRSLVMVL